MKKDNFFFMLSILGIVLLIVLVLNINMLFPLPNEQEVLAHFVSLDQQTTERGTTPDAQVTLTEFSDFECPYSKAALPLIQQFHQEYGTKINIVYKHAPIIQIHPNSGNAAEAAECARAQGKFWAYHELLFANQQFLDINSLKGYAAQLNLDIAKFNTCMDTHEKVNVIEQDLQEAIEKGIQGTPTFFVNDFKVSGANYEQIKIFIDQQIEAKT